jgi:hypothetical protein
LKRTIQWESKATGTAGSRNKRGVGEWFALSQDDLNAFKRWKRIT